MRQRIKLDHHGDTLVTAIAALTPLAVCAVLVGLIKLDYHGDTPLTAIAPPTPLAACAVLWGSRAVE